MYTKTDDLMTVAEVCAVLRCHRATVFRMLRSGELERVKIRSKTLVTRESVDELVAGELEKTSSE